MGVHTVSVKHKDMHIPGSPFGECIEFVRNGIRHSSILEFTVGPIQGGGAHKVRASGNGLIRGEVNSTSKHRVERAVHHLLTSLVPRRIQYLHARGRRWRSRHCHRGPGEGGDRLLRSQGRLVRRVVRLSRAR